MREILFRGQTRRYGEKVRIGDGQKLPSRWVYGGVLQGAGVHSIIYGGEHENNPSVGLDKWVVYTDTLGQFTGLTDNNGMKIFEGDIVKCRHRIYKSNFEEFEDKKIRRSYGKEIEEVFIGGFNCFYWRNYAVSINDGCVKIQNGSDSHYIRKNYIYNHAIEVIGNIHDNPELLEVKDGN